MIGTAFVPGQSISPKGHLPKVSVDVKSKVMKPKRFYTRFSKV
jgi:hypothetical protein